MNDLRTVCVTYPDFDSWDINQFSDSGVVRVSLGKISRENLVAKNAMEKRFFGWPTAGSLWRAPT